MVNRRLAMIGKEVVAEIIYIDSSSTALAWKRPNGTWQKNFFRREVAEKFFEALVDKWLNLGKKINIEERHNG